MKQSYIFITLLVTLSLFVMGCGDNTKSIQLTGSELEVMLTASVSRINTYSLASINNDIEITGLESLPVKVIYNGLDIQFFMLDQNVSEEYSKNCDPGPDGLTCYFGGARIEISLAGSD